MPQAPYSVYPPATGLKRRTPTVPLTGPEATTGPIDPLPGAKIPTAPTDYGATTGPVPPSIYPAMPPPTTPVAPNQPFDPTGKIGTKRQSGLPGYTGPGMTTNLGANPFDNPALGQPPETTAPTTPGSPTTPTAPTPPAAPATTDWSAADWTTVDREKIKGYAASRGRTFSDQEADYWVGKWPELAARGVEIGNPNYAFGRLQVADQFTGGGGGTGQPGGYANPATSPFTDDIRKILLDRIAKDSVPLDDNDPAISAAMSGARLTSERQMEAERRQLSEQLFAGGDLSNGVRDQQVQQSRERGAASLSTLKGSLMMREVDARRTDLTNLLQMAIASGDADLARQTQVALANLEAMLRREGFGWDAAFFQQNQNRAAVPTGTGSN